MELRKATRKQAKLRIGLSGASGFGKTYSALKLAKGIAGSWEKVAIIDTENGSADLYEDLGDYQVLSLTPPFTPERYIEAIGVCEQAGIEVVIVDSITHEWNGEGGCLDIHASLGGKFQDWSKVTPRHNAFINKILQSSCHVITTVRRKQEYEMVNSGGKTKVQKAGTKEITREGFEYELTLSFELINENHLALASKDRTSLFDSRPEFIITEDTGKELLAWANKGVDPKQEAINAINTVSSREEFVSTYKKYPQYHSDISFTAAAKKVSEKYPKKNAA